MSADHLPEGPPSMHATHEALELYSLRLLKGDDLDSIEEHLLVCEFCRSSLSSVDQEIALLRDGLRQLELEKRVSAIQSKTAARKVLMFKPRPGN